MKDSLFRQAIVKFLCGLLLVGALIFLPAWTLRYWQGWLLMGILFVPMFLAGLVMLRRSPELLRRRLNAKEEQVLEAGLEGYAAYKQRVRYRLIPGIW